MNAVTTPLNAPGDWLAQVAQEAQADLPPQPKPRARQVQADGEELPSRVSETLEEVEGQEEEVLDEEVEEESEAEEEAAPEAEAEEEPKAKAAPKVQPAQPPPEVPAPTHTFEQAQQAFYAQFLVATLKQSGYQVADDGSNVREVIAQHYNNDPLGWNEVLEAGKRQAAFQAEQYRQQHIAPFQQRKMWEQNSQFVSRFETRFPDVGQYAQQMRDLWPQVQKDWPELAADPARAIPMLYQMAKEKPLAKAATRLKNASKGRLESGGARTPKGRAPARRDPVDSIFGPVPNPFT